MTGRVRFMIRNGDVAAPEQNLRSSQPLNDGAKPAQILPMYFSPASLSAGSCENFRDQKATEKKDRSQADGEEEQGARLGSRGDDSVGKIQGAAG